MLCNAMASKASVALSEMSCKGLEVKIPKQPRRIKWSLMITPRNFARLIEALPAAASTAVVEILGGIEVISTLTWSRGVPWEVAGGVESMK